MEENWASKRNVNISWKVCQFKEEDLKIQAKEDSSLFINTLDFFMKPQSPKLQLC